MTTPGRRAGGKLLNGWMPRVFALRQGSYPQRATGCCIRRGDPTSAEHPIGSMRCQYRGKGERKGKEGDSPHPPARSNRSGSLARRPPSLFLILSLSRRRGRGVLRSLALPGCGNCEPGDRACWGSLSVRRRRLGGVGQLRRPAPLRRVRGLRDAPHRPVGRRVSLIGAPKGADRRLSKTGPSRRPITGRPPETAIACTDRG